VIKHPTLHLLTLVRRQRPLPSRLLEQTNFPQLGHQALPISALHCQAMGRRVLSEIKPRQRVTNPKPELPHRLSIPILICAAE
tara:strand:- start:359 stop:607 length:249 start_codon:yes stop_codon:yes gene_type:complete